MYSGVVLVVDDDSDALLSLTRVLKGELPEVTFHGAGNALRAIELQQAAAPHVAILDLCLEAKKGVSSGFELLERLKSADPGLRVIVLTGHSSVEHGITAMQKGAASFLEKPANIQHLKALLSDALSQATLRRELEERLAQAANHNLSRICGKSPAAVKLREEISFAAFSRQPVFIAGESGTGKGLCATLIHESSKQHSGQFIRYQPSFVSSDLVNSDLFGHVKGAFTGADSDRKGLLEQASGGTLFLDEVDALPPETQVLLLGVLQDGKFRRVGENIERTANFRLIAASNAPIAELIVQGKFRKDLFYRLAHLQVTIPPLRQRKEDIEQLVSSYLAFLREREEVSVCGISAEALQKLYTFDWPGNVRELFAVIEGAAYRSQFADRFEILPVDIRFQGVLQPDQKESASENGFHQQVHAFKLKLIQEALDRNAGNQVRAAQELGLDRSTMRRLLAQT